MQIRCVATSLTEEQVAGIGSYYRAQAFHVTIGSTYLVLGLSFHVGSNLFGTTAVAEIQDDFERLASVPLLLFEVVEPRVSAYWRIKVWEDATVTVWPEPFYEQYFHDDLSEDIPGAVEQFRRVRDAIRYEASIRAPE